MGIDVGGTRTKGVVLSDLGEVLAENTRATTNDDDPDTLGAAIGAQVTALTDGLDLRIRQVGVAVPGLVDEARGIGVFSANLGWRDLDLAGTLSRHLPAPVHLAHDVRAGLLGEHRLGAARGWDNVCFVPIGTGIAAALLIGGRLIRGGTWTGEIGHVVVDPEGPRCQCGRRGCLETLFGGAALERRWQEAGHAPDGAREVARRAGDGHAVAGRIWQQGIDALVDVLAPVVAAGGVELVVVGGGLARAGSVLLDPMSDGLAQRLGGPPVPVVPALLGDLAGAHGAAVLAAMATGDR